MREIRRPRSTPGDVGTSGGLLCDERTRDLREDDAVFGGLYAAGNNAASPMGRAYPVRKPLSVSVLRSATSRPRKQRLR
jgi:hypothetical protein